MLLDNLKRLSKDSLVYGFGSVVQFATAILLLPIFSRIFSPSDYGTFDAISTLTSILVMFLLLGLNSATQRYYYDFPADGSLIISTALWFLIAISMLSCGLLIAGSGFIAQSMFGQEKNAPLLIVALATIPLTLIIQFTKDVLRLRFATWHFNIISFIEFFLGLGLIFYFVVISHRGLIGSLLGTFLASAAAASIGFWLIRKNIVLRLSRKYLKSLLRYGFPLVFAGFAYWIVSLSDRLFLLKLGTLQQLGLYSFGNKISSVLVLVITAIQLAWFPLIFGKYKEKESNLFVVKTLTYTTILYGGIAVALTAFAPVALRLLAPPNYSEAANVVGLLSLSLVFLGIAPIFSTGITLAEKTKYITISSVMAALVNIALNALLIPHLGMMGAAISTLASYAILASLYYIYSQKWYPLHFETGRVIKILALAGAFVWVAQVANQQSLGAEILVKTGVIVAFPLALLALRILSGPETEFIRSIWKKAFNHHQLPPSDPN